MNSWVLHWGTGLNGMGWLVIEQLDSRLVRPLYFGRAKRITVVALSLSLLFVPSSCSCSHCINLIAKGAKWINREPGGVGYHTEERRIQNVVAARILRGKLSAVVFSLPLKVAAHTKYPFARSLPVDWLLPDKYLLYCALVDDVVHCGRETQ